MKTTLILVILVLLVIVTIYLVKKLRKPKLPVTIITTTRIPLPVKVQTLFVMKCDSAFSVCGLDATTLGTDKQVLYFKHTSPVPMQFTQLYTDKNCTIKFVGGEVEYSAITNYTGINDTINHVIFITSNGIATQVYQCLK